jgi:FkbM family methyltransferase
MHYKFIDIGCGINSVSTDRFGVDAVGMLVEPIKEYLDILPSGNNIIKENCAIFNTDGQIEFNAVIVDNPRYFTEKEMQSQENLNIFQKQYAFSGHSSVYSKTNLKHFKKIIVPCLTLKSLFNKHNVTSIDYLKIDVEGFENILLLQLLNLMKKNKICVNKEIKFEYNHLSDLKKLDNVTKIFEKQFGFKSEYVIGYPWNHDIILTK